VKIYTRTGDEGTTGLFGGRRVRKTNPRVEAYGAVDELNAVLGLAASVLDDEALRDQLLAIQNRLFDVGADIATPPDAKAGDWLHRVPSAWVSELEADIDTLQSGLPALAAFILPGGTSAAAALHMARTACRRAERRLLAATESGEPIGEPVPRYLNRLSDYLFVAARAANASAGVDDVTVARD